MVNRTPLGIAARIAAAGNVTGAVMRYTRRGCVREASLYSVRLAMTGDKKSPRITGAKQQGSVVLTVKIVLSYLNESAGLAVPEQPTRFAEISATDSPVSYQI